MIALLALVVISVALAWGTYALSYSEYFSFQKISVKGAERTPTSEIIAYVNSIMDDGKFHFISRRNTIYYPKVAIETALATNFPRIAAAELVQDKPFGSDLVIRVLERVPFSKWCTAPTLDSTAQCFWMDKHGYIFAHAEEGERGTHEHVFEGGVARVTQPIGQTFAPAHVEGIMAMLGHLADADFKPTGASIEGEHDLHVRLADGFYIKASYGQDAAQIARNLELVLTSESMRGKEESLEYVDLRFGNRVYYKFRGAEESGVY